MRPIISYDDIATEPAPEYQPPPTKKRRKDYNRGGQRHCGHGKEDRLSSEKKTRVNYGINEESRHLEQEEIWDDSSLIEAWEAAAEEYEVLNGPEKKWKTEPIRKSALWYNIPPQQKEASSTFESPFMPGIPPEFASYFHEDDRDGEKSGENSKPMDFNSFMPEAIPNQVVPPPLIRANQNLTQDAVFGQAMGAWYRAGYWTAIYHMMQKKETGGHNDGQVDVNIDADSDAFEADEEVKTDEDSDGLLPT